MIIIDNDNIETVWHLLTSKVVPSTTIEADIFFSPIKQPIPKDWRSILFTSCETPLSPARVNNRKGLDSSDQTMNGWLSLVKEQLYSNLAVEDIFVSIEGSEVDIRVVIPERNLAILHEIVEKEGELFETLVSGESPPFLVDFHIIYRCGRNIEELAPTRAIRLPR